MTDLLDRTAPTRHDESGKSPPRRVPIIHGHDPTPWPRRARIVIAILTAATLVSTIGWILATRGEGTIGDQATVAELTDERDTLAAERDALLTERASLLEARGVFGTKVALLDAQLHAARTDVDRLDEARSVLTADLDATAADLDAALADLDAAETAVAGLERELVTAGDVSTALDQRIAVLDGEIARLLTRAAAAEADRDALADLFPITFDTTVDDIALVGTWDVDWSEVYCEGLATCDSTPGFEVMKITRTGAGWLRLEIDGVLTAGLFRVDGALYAITDSTTATPACGTAQRQSYVSMTLYQHGVAVADDGTHTVTDLGASMLIQAPATGGCPMGTAFYGAELTHR